MHGPRTCLRIASVEIDLETPIPVEELGIKWRLSPFFATTQDPIARWSIRWEESDRPPAPCGELVFDPGSIVRIYRDGADYVATITYEGLVPALLRTNATWDDLTLTEQRTGAGWRSLLSYGVGELLFRTGMIRTGGLVLHASGVDDHGRGLVFVGHSGEGKSTQLGLWGPVPGVIAMGDDRIAVRLEPDGPVCYSLPWGGASVVNRDHRAPLSALVLMEHAEEDDIARLTPAEAAPRVLARTFLPFWDRTLMSCAMANLDGLLSCVPVYHLRCQPGPDLIPLVRSVL
jgi:hypothetical protein